jgi:AAA domain
MRLVSADLHGYRRFAEPTKIDLYGRLIAIVGPNEAGKSSILQALDEIDTNTPIPQEDLTRRGEIAANRVVVKLRWLVEPADRAAIAHLHSGSDPKRAYWLVVSKQADGRRMLTVEPRLVRDLDPRRQLAERLDDARKAEGWLAEVETQDTPGEPKRLSRLIEALKSQAQTLHSDYITEVRELAALLHAHGDEGLARYLDDLADHESQPHPNNQAATILFNRISRFLPFDEPERALDSQYDLDVTAAEPPAALVLQP